MERTSSAFDLTGENALSGGKVLGAVVEHPAAVGVACGHPARHAASLVEHGHFGARIGKPPGGGKESRDREVETAELSGAARAVAANSDGDAVLELDVTELKKAASRASKKRPQEALRKTSLAVR